MSRSLSKSAPLTQSNSLSAKLDGIRAGSSMARMDANSADSRELVRDLMIERGLTQKAMAINAGCAESDLSNALQGKQRLDFEWLLAQDALFRKALARRLDQTDQEQEDALLVAEVAALFERVLGLILRRRERLA